MLKCIALEPTTQFHGHLKDRYVKFFQNADYKEVDIRFFTTEKDIRKVLSSENIDILISDLSFDSEDLSGLLIIQSIKRDFPDVFIIGNSRADIGFRQVAARLPNFDLFVEKGGLYGDDISYLAAVRDEFVARFRRNTEIIISEKSLFWENAASRIRMRDIQSMLAQVFFVGHGIDGGAMPTKAVLSPLSGGRSSSMVYKLLGLNKSDAPITVPAVLKISPIENAIREKLNYDEFVKWILPYSWRVDVLGFGIAKSWGAICYSFIKSGYDDFDALTKFVLDGDRSVISAIVQKVFNPNMRHWYSQNFLGFSDSINERYQSRYFPTVSIRNEAGKIFDKTISGLFGGNVEKGCIRIFGKKISHPLDTLFGQPNGSYHSCICHGDMNTNNLIVSSSGEVIFIDFQQTGRGHVFEDFVTLEASIRINFSLQEKQLSEKEWGEFVEHERQMAMGVNLETINPLFSILQHIRKLARENFDFENFRNYHYAVAAYNLKLLKLSGLTSNQKGRALAAIIVAIEHLA